MKKVLIFCLILLCTLSVFAVDFSAQVVLHMSYGENGFSFGPNAGTWEPNFTFATNGDVAGGSFKIAFPDYGIAFNFETWVKPSDPCKITIGSNVIGSLKKGITSDTSYGNIEWSNKSGSKYKIGFGYKPNYTNTGVKESNVFFAGEVNQFIVDKNFLHLDAITKLNVVEGKADLVSVISDAYWIYGTSVDSSTYKISAIDQNFGWNEETYNNRRDYSYDGAYVSNTKTNAITAGLRYKYYTQEDKAQYNGLYGYAWGNYVSDGIIYQAEAEVGKTISLELGSTGGKTYNDDGTENKRTFSEIVYARADFDFTGDKVNARLSEVYSKLTYGIFGKDKEEKIVCLYTPQLLINYNNKASNTPENNGLFLTPGVTTNIGNCGIDYGFKLGVDSLKKFHWNSELKTTVGF